MSIEMQDITENNFELEQDILKCWNMTSDVKEIAQDFVEGQMNQQDFLQALDAYVKVYENRFDRCFRRYELVCRGLHEMRRALETHAMTKSIKPKKSKKSSDEKDN
jgi:hypothetical protein